MTFEQIKKATLEELEARLEVVKDKKFWLEMADFLRGKEKEEHDNLHRELCWLLSEIRERKEALEG